MVLAPDTSPRGLGRWLVLFAALSLGLVASGWLYYRFQASTFRAEAERQLMAIAALKAEELIGWRAERLSDARFYQDNLTLARLVAAHFASGSERAADAELQSWFGDAQRSQGYGVFLLDASGNVRLSAPARQAPLEAHLHERAIDVVSTAAVEFVDFYRSEHTGAVHLAVVIPLRAVRYGDPAQGALVWRLDPAVQVYPILRRWPTESRSAELLLVRREGDAVVLLNPLRAQPFRALIDNIPLSRTTLPPVRASLGYHGVIEAPDTRGVPVLAATRAVSGTPWAVVAQVDRSEVFGPLRERLWATVAVTGALLCASGAVVGLLWRQQTARHYRMEMLAQTALREQADALRETGQMLRFHLENSPLAMVEWDTAFRVLRWSARAEAMFGWSAAEVVGKHPTEWPFVDPDDVAHVTDVINELLSGLVPRNQSINRNVTSDGRVLHCEWYNSVRPDAEGGMSSILSLVDDVSVRVDAEQKLRALNDELEQRVKNRTAELEVKNRELEVFTYSVSHDLKAPLRGIEGYSRLLVDDYADALDEEARYFLANIRKAAGNMGRLIDDLLSYSRLERRPTQVTRVALRALVETLLAERALDIETHGAVVSTELPPGTVQADPQGLSVALGNLLDNALKFSQGNDTPRITIGAETGRRGTHIWVRDNGIGFDMKYADRIFDIFQRLHRAEDYPGTGIGLAIVRKCMERMHGRVRAESRDGEGTTFHLELPA